MLSSILAMVIGFLFVIGLFCLLAIHAIKKSTDDSLNEIDILNDEDVHNKDGTNEWSEECWVQALDAQTLRSLLNRTYLELKVSKNRNTYKFFLLLLARAVIIHEQTFVFLQVVRDNQDEDSEETKEVLSSLITKVCVLAHEEDSDAMIRALKWNLEMIHKHDSKQDIEYRNSVIRALNRKYFEIALHDNRLFEDGEDAE